MVKDNEGLTGKGRKNKKRKQNKGELKERNKKQEN